MNIDPQTFLKIAILFTISLTVSLLGTYLVRKLAIKYHIGEQPHPRKIHKTFTPHMGGLGIFAGFLAGLLLSIFLFPGMGKTFLQNYMGLLAASVLIIGLGVFDDLKGLNANRKFIGQFIIVTILIFTGCKIESVQIPFWATIPLGVFSIPITYLWLIGVSNAVNLLDGLDGLAAGFSAIAATIIGIIAWQYHNIPLTIISISLVAGLLGFLKFNFYPAKIFMGDTGSLFLGLILAALSLKTFEHEPGQINFLLPLIILAIPIGDTAVAFFRRLNNGKHPFKPDKDHFHHRLIYLGLSHKHAVLIIYATSFIFAFIAYFVATQSFFVSIILIGAVLTVSFFSLNRIGYLEAKRNKFYYGEAAIIPVKKDIAPLSIKRFVHKILFALNDIILINVSLFVTWWLKYESGWFAVDRVVPFSEFWATPVSLILTLFWLILFVLNDLYSIRWYISRFDHLRRMIKVISFGIFLIFILTLDPGAILSGGRITVLIYAVVLIISVGTGRLMLIKLEKYFSILEYAPHKTILIGATEKGRKLLKDIKNNPHLLYRMVGYVTKEYQDKKFYGLDCLGTYSQISRLVREHGIEEVIIAINERSRDEILNIVAMTGNDSVAFKILPEMYDVVSGHKTAEMTGHPLIQLFPEPMRLWQWGFKRFFDVAVSFIMLILLSPVFLIILGLLVLSGIYPPFVIENVIGKYGKRFGMLNLNTLANGKRTGVAKLIYYSRFYKFPALLNIFLGQMSFVGPRPEENKNFETVRKKIKFYNRRFQIRPGLTGWAQVRYRYEEALKFKREQLKQDLYYLENMSLALDLRILLRSAIIFFLGFKKTK